MKKYYSSFYVLLLSAFSANGAWGAEIAPVSDEMVGSNVELAQKIAGEYNAVQKGETTFNDWFDWESFTRCYRTTVEAEGDNVYVKNFNDYGSETVLIGTVDASAMQVVFENQRVYVGWVPYSFCSPEGGTFTATISDDFSSISFSPFWITYDEDPYEKTESLELSHMEAPVMEWCVTGTTHFETNDGITSEYIADNKSVMLTKYMQGTEARYELSSLGGVYEFAPSVQFTVNKDGTLNYLNAFAGCWYDGVNSYFDSVVAYSSDDDDRPASGISGDAESGQMYFQYEYYENFNDWAPTEMGMFTFTWGTAALPKYTTDPASGSEVEGFDRIVYTFDGVNVADFSSDYEVSIVDEEGNPACENVSMAWAAGMNQLAVNCSMVTEPGTYTITIRKGSVILDGVTYDGNITITLNVVKSWSGEYEMPDEVASIDELTSLPITFLYAKEVERSGYAVLGAVYDTKGEVYGLIFSNGTNSNLAGGIETEGATATVHFEKMSSLRAQNARLAESFAKKVGAFVSPSTGVATVYIAPKSFKVDGAVFGEAIVKTIEVTGAGQTTGIDGIDIEQRTNSYDLQGRKLARPVHGQTFISNGKKVVK